jgi:tetratricopeptide (TPR) repeat protein
MPHKRRLAFLLALVLCISLFHASCSRGGEDMVELLVSTEEGGYKGEEVDRERIAELEAAVRAYGKEIQQRVQDTGKLGIYYRILALDLMEKKMYGPALEQFEKALEIYPANPVLLYYAGVCRTYLAKASADLESRKRGIQEASLLYERAVEMDGRYENALYASAVLAVFDMEEISEAQSRVNRLLRVYPEHIGGSFLLARLYLAEGYREAAAEVYHHIAESSRASDDEKRRARDNRAAILGGAYE